MSRTDARSELAVLRWISPEGAAPSVPNAYRGVAQFEDQDRAIADGWSVVVESIRDLGSRAMLVRITFVVEHAPTHLLDAGHRFELVENKVVAKGVMIASQIPLPNTINEFELALIG